MQVADSETDPAGIASVPTGVRWVVLAGMTGSVVVAYLTRAALAPAGSLIKSELHLSNTELGEILGIWAAGYIGFQLPVAGWAIAGEGGSLLPIYALVWSLCTLVTAGAGSFAGMWWSRLVFGMAQAGLIPCLTKACMDWFPQDRRGFASAAITAGMSVGAVAASGLSAVHDSLARLADHLGSLRSGRRRLGGLVLDDVSRPSRAAPVGERG